MEENSQKEYSLLDVQAIEYEKMEPEAVLMGGFTWKAYARIPFDGNNGSGHLYLATDGPSFLRYNNSFYDTEKYKYTYGEPISDTHANDILSKACALKSLSVPEYMDELRQLTDKENADARKLLSNLDLYNESRRDKYFDPTFTTSSGKVLDQKDLEEVKEYIGDGRGFDILGYVMYTSEHGLAEMLRDKGDLEKFVDSLTPEETGRFCKLVNKKYEELCEADRFKSRAVQTAYKDSILERPRLAASLVASTCYLKYYVDAVSKETHKVLYPVGITNSVNEAIDIVKNAEERDGEYLTITETQYDDRDYLISREVIYNGEFKHPEL